jgi:hypothetical protein
MDGLSYTVEVRDGVSVAVGTWAPVGVAPIYFELPYESDAVLEERLLSLQDIYASLRD